VTRREIGGRWLRTAWWAAPLLAAALLVTACGTRYSRMTLQDTDDATVVLRAEIKHGKPVDQHYKQPATIAAIRITHILAAIDVRKDVTKEQVGDREAAVPTQLLYPLGDMLSQALAKADSTQQVVVMALRKQRRLGVFTEKYLTSLIAFVDDQNRLEIHFSRIDWLVPKSKEGEIKEPRLGHPVMKFHVLPGQYIEPIGPQSVAVDWQDPYFRNASIVRVTPGGDVVRRTILMESPSPAAAGTQGKAPEQPNAEPEIPTEPQALRALADLEEARRAGRITEAEYQRRRQEILDQAEKR
jgi:hypothetical protein